MFKNIYVQLKLNICCQFLGPGFSQTAFYHVQFSSTIYALPKLSNLYVLPLNLNLELQKFQTKLWLYNGIEKNKYILIKRKKKESVSLIYLNWKLHIV